MTSKCMSSIVRNFSAIKCYRLGNTRILRSLSNPDYNTVVIGLALWYGILLDYNVMFCNAERADSNHGRIVKHASNGWDINEVDLSVFLNALDEISEILLKNLSAVDGFKVHLFLTELKTWKVPFWMNPLKGSILSVINTSFEDVDEGRMVQAIRAVRQISCFLKKLDVTRADLIDQTESEFLLFEEFLAHDVPRRMCSIGYQEDVSAMRRLLLTQLDDFKMDTIVPVHGPGAVDDPSIKSWYEKHTRACSDRRIGYLLAHTGLGKESDYLPFVKEEKSARTSRYICVPKTWKKLRGISAESPELQFWQQGVLENIDRMFKTSKFWSQRIDLHDQNKSRTLALLGSSTGTFSTVDLSAASDSVTLQLVRDLFGNTLLGRWLLGTRSTHTTCRDSVLRIHKFAPMGSACCFPTECIIFCLAAEVAVRRTWTPSQKSRQVCVFGDDIIVPSYATQELFSILSHLGFSCNIEKSFWEGQFREACGIEAWNGFDIAPCRYKTCVSGSISRRSDYDEIASLGSLANELFARGLHDTRRFLLEILFNKEVQLGNNQRLGVQAAFFTSFSGERNTLASPYATNFHLKRKMDRSLQTHVYRRIVWQRRPISRNVSSEMSGETDVCEYVDWLIRHQPGTVDYEEMWSQGWIECMESNPYDRLPIGMTMVPTVKWVTPSSYDFLMN